MSVRLYTYGYGGGGHYEDLAPVMDARGILLDIRYSPMSRVPKWRRGALLREFGPQYQFCPHLGNVNYKTGGPIEIADFCGGLERLAEAMTRGPVVMMCGCKSVQSCHRSVVADQALRIIGVGEVVDLRERLWMSRFTPGWVSLPDSFEVVPR